MLNDNAPRVSGHGEAMPCSGTIIEFPTAEVLDSWIDPSDGPDANQTAADEGASGEASTAEILPITGFDTTDEGTPYDLPYSTNDMWPGVKIIGDLDAPEAYTALNAPISVLFATTTITSGTKWELLQGDVRGLLTSHLCQHPVSANKDGNSLVFAVGEKSSKHTSNGQVTQYACRIQDKIEAITALFIDVDGTDKAARVAARIKELGLCGVVYTTHSHAEKKTEKGDRFRVIIFLEEWFEFPSKKDGVEARRQAVAEYHARYVGMCEKLGLKDIDASGMNLHQMMYAPRRASENAEFEHYFIVGRLLPIDEMPKGDPSKYRKSALKDKNGKVLSKKEFGTERTRLSDGFDIGDWYHSDGKHLLLIDVLDMIGWDVRGETNNGWYEIQCPNHAEHSDPEQDSAGVIEGDDGFGFHCFHDHCQELGLVFLKLIEDAILAGEAVLSEEHETFSDLLCDPAFYPDEIDGEEPFFDKHDFGVEITLERITTARQADKAFCKVVDNTHAGRRDWAMLFGGVAKGGDKDNAVAKLDELIEGTGKFSANDRKRLKKAGAEMLAEEKKRYALDKAEQRLEAVKDAIESSDLAHPSMDPAEPLGDTLEAALATLGKRYAPCDMNGKFRIVRKPDLNALNSDFDSTIVVYTKQDFLDLHANRHFAVDGDLVFPAKEFLGAQQRKSGIVFAPTPKEPGPNDFNMYQGRKMIGVAGESGNTSDFPKINDFLKDIVCKGDNDKYKWLMLWMAHMVQFPGEKPGTAVIATGPGGIGKGTMGSILMKLTAPHCKQLENEAHVVGQFAGDHLSKCILVVVNEAVFGLSPRVSSTLKALVDSTTIEAEAKGMPLVSCPSFSRFYFDSNDKVPVLIENNGSERRYFVLLFSDEKKQDKAYFKALREAIDGDEMAHFLHYLEQYKPPEGSDWGDVRVAPETPERIQMGLDSMRPSLRRLAEVLDEGLVTLPSPEGHETFTASKKGLRVPLTRFKEYIAKGAGFKARAEDRDIEGMFEQLHPNLSIKTARGSVGGEDNIRWIEFPIDALGAGAVETALEDDENDGEVTA